MPISEKKRQWLKEYRQRNKEHIRKISRARYLRNRDARIKKVHEWRDKNMDKINANRKRKYWENKEIADLRNKTRYYFNDLKKRSVCQICGSKVKLEFHHFKPYKYDNFIIVCQNCHRMIENRLLVRDPKNGGINYSLTNESVGGKT